MTSPFASTARRSVVPQGFAALGRAVTFPSVIFLASFEQGTSTAGAPVAHELSHEARHLLGFPCH